MTNKLKHKEKFAKKQELANAPAVVNPADQVDFGMDGTSHTEISFMGNEDFSTEIIKDTPALSDFEKLMVLQSEGGTKFLMEAEEKILKLWHSIESLTAHTDLYLVTFQIEMGKILNAVEEFFEKKSSCRTRRARETHRVIAHLADERPEALSNRGHRITVRTRIV